MKTSTKILLTILVMIQTLSANEPKSSFSIEIDPSTYVFDGYALHLKKSFEALPHWQFGIGVYAMDFPSLLVDLNDKNRDKGLEQRLDFGIGLFVDYFFEENQDGFFVGGQLAHQKYKLTQTGETAEYTSMLGMTYLGYQYEFSHSFYLKPWAGIGYQTKISGSNKINVQEFDIAPILLFATLHIGYKF